MVANQEKVLAKGVVLEHLPEEEKMVGDGVEEDLGDEGRLLRKTTRNAKAANAHVGFYNRRQERAEREKDEREKL